jgi:hypothetical protein
MQMTITKKQEKVLDKYLSLREEYEMLKQIMEETEDEIKNILREIDGHTVKWGGHQFTLVEAERRSFDASALKELVSNSVFRKVTEPVVKTTLIDAAVKIGTIQPEVVDAITSITPYTQLRVK